jgi:hypothetical protein
MRAWPSCLLLTATLAVAGEPASIWVLTLHNAIEGGKALTIHLDPASRQAIGVAHAFNHQPQDVDASAFKIDGPALSGQLKVTLNPDSWTPKDGKPIPCLYTIEATMRGVVGGVFKGTCGEAEVSGDVTGRAEPAPAKKSPARFELKMENAVPLATGTASWHNRAVASFTVADGRALAARFASPGTTYADFSATVPSCDFTFDGSTLKGTLTAAVKSSKLTDTLQFALDGRAVGGVAAGRFTRSIAGKEAGGGLFLGSVEHVAGLEPADAIYTLVLDGAVAGDKALRLHLDRRGGRFAAGLGFAPAFNHECHDADPAGLTLDGGSLRGVAKVTIQPDPYVPRDGKAIACAYALDVTLKHGAITGTFKGTCGPDPVSGTAAGEIGLRPKLGDSFDLSLKMEQGVSGGSPWHNRTYLAVQVRGGKVVGGSCSNNKGGFSATFDGASLKLVGGTSPSRETRREDTLPTIVGTIVATVASGTVAQGTYTFTFAGRLVGGHVVGTFEARLADKVVQKGRFSGTLREAG